MIHQQKNSPYGSSKRFNETFLSPPIQFEKFSFRTPKRFAFLSPNQFLSAKVGSTTEVFFVFLLLLGHIRTEVEAWHPPGWNCGRIYIPGPRQSEKTSSVAPLLTNPVKLFGEETRFLKHVSSANRMSFH
ncbi:hypothetical protein TNCV_1455601 [Trichonephila clavipes]|nr:hypothetical protein TNCV_1455601 [Trichonephila clavipes]